MFSGLAAAGVGVRMTNPVGALFRRYPARNHKKLILADDVAYIGGVNFSDHNFAWSDFMVRLEGEAAARFLADDFAATYAGAPRPARADLGDVRLYAMDGRSNAGAFAEIFALIQSARREVMVVSPYLTFPFTDALAAARRRGVTVRLVTPRANNKPIARRYALAQARRHGFEVRLAPAMSHVKAMVIDGETLVAGSSNFDFVSLAAEEELVAVIASSDLAGRFAATLEQALGPAGQADALPPSRGVWAATALLRIADLFARSARTARRTAIDWPPRVGRA
jgi:cardiolipin synthase